VVDYEIPLNNQLFERSFLFDGRDYFGSEQFPGTPYKGSGLRKVAADGEF
jgi:hypothetical protein